MSGNSIEAGRTVTNKVSSILLAFNSGGELSMTEVAKLAGIPISTAYRLMTELADLRLLERQRNGRWRLGLSLRNVGGHDTVPPTLVERAPCILEDLVEITARRARLGVWRELDVAYIEKRPESAAVTSFSTRATLPAHPTALGRALLAFAPSLQVQRTIDGGLQSYTGHTVTSPARLRHALAVTRLTRVAITRREFEADLCGVAMPVFGPGGHVIAAIEIAANNLDDDLQRIVSPLLIATRSLSRELAGPAGAVTESAPGPQTGTVRHPIPLRAKTTASRVDGVLPAEAPLHRSTVRYG